MAVTFTGAGTATAASGASPQAVTTATALAVGDFLVVLMAYDNSGGGGADPMTGTIALSGGFTGASVSAQTGHNDPGSASAGLAARCVCFPVTTAIPTSTVINVSWTGTVVVRAVTFMKVSGAGIVGYRSNSGATGTNTVNLANATAFVTPAVNIGEGVLCWTAEENGVAIGGDADTLRGTWGTIYGTFTGTGVAGMAAYMQGKAVTANGTQTFNPTGNATLSDWITGALLFTETPLVTQAAYRFYDSGTETGAVALAAQDTAAIGDLTAGDGIGQLRIRVQATAGVAASGFTVWQLQWEKNASGTWTNITTGSGSVRGYNDPNIAEADFTSNRLSGGTGLFTVGRIGEDGVVDNAGTTDTGYTELLYSLQIMKADFVAGDVIRFRVLLNGATTGMTYTAVPTINVVVTPVAVTQAAYRIYDDGTETGAVALAAQDTPADGDVTNGDGIGQLRVRLQSTTVAPIPATDDFQLQWEKNASGTWTNVVSTDVDSYSEENGNSSETIGASGIVIGQSFTGNGKPLSQCGFFMSRLGSPSGTVTAGLYAHSGTYGTSSVGTGSPLATSTPVDVMTLPTSDSWFNFVFDGSFTLVNGTNYVIAVSGTSGSNTISIRLDNSSPTHAGNKSRLVGGWTSAASVDCVFRVLTTGGTAVAYNSPNLTEGAATTNRLGAGTGSFVAGKVAEDGLVDDLGWAGNNYTELLFPVAIKKPDVVAGDVIRFRVLRNGATTAMTYTAVPTVNVIRGVANISATITSDWDTWTATAAGTVTLAAVEVFGTISTNWGGWDAQAAGLTDHPGTITTSWGGWTATATGTVTHDIAATISTNWSGVGVSHAWNGADPANSADNQDYELGTKFTVSTPTSCVGIRIRNPGNTWLGAADDRYAKLWDGVTQTRLKTLNITETMPSGWSEFLWDAPVALEAAHDYVVSYNVSAEGYCQTTHLLDTPVVSGPVTLIMGQFNSSPGSYPAGSYQNSFYGVDVLYGGTGGGWTATAIGTVSAGAVTHVGIIASNWGTWTATGVATIGHSATITSTWGNWTATANALREAYAGISTSWGQWTASALAGVQHPGTIASSWGTWTATATGTVGPTAIDRPGTISSDWGTWTATANGVVTAEVITATIASSWGTWTATAQGTVVAEIIPATIVSNWGTWTATAVGTVAAEVISASITSNWGTWSATATALPLTHPATVASSWGTWTATASALPIQRNATIASPWGTWTATAAGTVTAEVISGTIASNWGGWTATATALPLQRNATIVSPWGTWTATALAQPVQRNATSTTSWGTWSATAVAQAIVHPATITSSWGTWTATAQGTVTAEVISATIASSWGTWTATAIGTQMGQAVGSIASDWGTWTATGLASRTTTGRVTENWGGWLATATAVRSTAATAVGTWGTWTATALARPIQRNATITSSWGTWNAVAAASLKHTASITTNWGTWTGVATGSQMGMVAGTISSDWGTWAATGLAIRTTTAKIADAWGGWVASGVASIKHPATITTDWGAWSATAVGQHSLYASISTAWETWKATAVGQRLGYAVITTTWDGWTAIAIGDVYRPGTIEGQWEGQTFGAMMWGSEQVVEWMMVDT